MKRRVKTVLLLVSLVTLIAAVRGSDQTDEGERLWETNVTSHVHLETDVDDVDSEKPHVSLCCRIGTFLTKDDCVEDATNETDAVQLPIIYEADLTSENITASDEHFSFVVWNPCIGDDRIALPLHIHQDEWYLLSNGSILRPLAKESESHLLGYRQYCLARVRNANTSKSMDYKYQKYSMLYCVDPTEEVSKETKEGREKKILYSTGMLISEPFLVATYVVYCLLPDLRNLHGLTLREYVGCLIVTYGLMAITLLAPPAWMSNYICNIIALIVTFTFSASFFWLNVICFDIWWTFREFRPIQGNVKQREKKQFTIYSIYVWGSASTLVIICAIIDLGFISVSNRPEFCGRGYCWFGTDFAELLYFWLPMNITIICNMCLFISTAVRLVRHKKYMAHHLRDSQFKRGDKKRFNLYLKLFFVMGVSWSMELVSGTIALIFDVSLYVFYITDLINVLQGIVIFIIFVWKKKTKVLLLKRLGCHDRILFSRNSTSRDCHTSVTGEMSLAVISSCRQKNSPHEVDS